jgi:hypothetical protein
MITLWTALLMGLVGSAHCAGMCGPICIALPMGESIRARALALLQYNFARVAVYAALGAFFGLVGAGVRIAGLQAGMSVAAGVAMLAAALFSIDIDGQLARWRPLKAVTLWVHQRLGALLRQPDSAWWKLGAMNGLLPCGLVYLAIAGALTLGNAAWGAGYLLAFGLGTLPAMLATGLLGQYLKPGWRSRLRAWYPALMAGVGLWLIYRGMHFHLPANFQFLQALDGAPMCH